jgi:hypothetical protein
VVSVTPRPYFTPGKDPVPIVQEAGWAPGPVWTGAENLAPTGIRSPDRPIRIQSLYRLSYPAHSSLVSESIFKAFVKPACLEHGQRLWTPLPVSTYRTERNAICGCTYFTKLLSSDLQIRRSHIVHIIP